MVAASILSSDICRNRKGNSSRNATNITTIHLRVLEKEKKKPEKLNSKNQSQGLAGWKIKWCFDVGKMLLSWLPSSSSSGPEPLPLLPLLLQHQAEVVQLIYTGGQPVTAEKDYTEHAPTGPFSYTATVAMGTYLPKAFIKATISCRLSWKPFDGLCSGKFWISFSEKRIFRAVPRPWVCTQQKADSVGRKEKLFTLIRRTLLRYLQVNWFYNLNSRKLKVKIKRRSNHMNQYFYSQQNINSIINVSTEKLYNTLHMGWMIKQ